MLKKKNGRLSDSKLKSGESHRSASRSLMGGFFEQGRGFGHSLRTESSGSTASSDASSKLSRSTVSPRALNTSYKVVQKPKASWNGSTRLCDDSMKVETVSRQVSLKEDDVPPLSHSRLDQLLQPLSGGNPGIYVCNAADQLLDYMLKNPDATSEELTQFTERLYDGKHSPYRYVGK
jgi:hypothetical protein